MTAWQARLSLGFSCLGHAYMHMLTAFFFVIVLALEVEWALPFHELIGLWTLGSLLVGLCAPPASRPAGRRARPAGNQGSRDRPVRETVAPTRPPAPTR